MSANLSDWRDLAKGGLLLEIYSKSFVIPAKGPHTGHAQLLRESIMHPIKLE
jgi:hypothetical protein